MGKESVFSRLKVNGGTGQNKERCEEKLNGRKREKREAPLSERLEHG